jgi:hypothetical protein
MPAPVRAAAPMPITAPSPTPRSLGATLANPAFPSLYAWAATVAAPSLDAGASVGARLAALAALVTAVIAGVLVMHAHRWARWVGIFGFVGLCVLCWLLLDGRGTGGYVRSWFGALGWVAFAFGWGGVRQLGSVPEEHPAALSGQPLRARSTLPLRASIALLLALSGGALCLALPWRVGRLPHAALAHVVGLVAAGGLLLAAGQLAAVPRAVRGAQPASLRLRAASMPLLLLGAALVSGAAWVWWQGRG